MTNRETVELEFNAELLTEAQKLGLDLDATVDAALLAATEEHKAAPRDEKKKDSP
tara:strand:- start:769 stop:933 length:165 start_codon:yes stop_codon:yes gene_type:complete